MKTDTRSFYESAVIRTVSRIVSSLDEALDLEALARQAALSTFHFHRVFRGMVGETPLEMHRRLRLERAASQALEGGVPITRIAFDAGYDTHEAFTRAFRRAYGVSPTGFRQSAVDLKRSCGRGQPVALAAKCGVHFRPDVDPHTSCVVAFIQGESTMNVTIETMPELRVAAVHHVGPYDRIANAFAELDTVVRPAGLLRDGAMMLAIYHDDPETTPAEQLRSDAGITVGSDASLPRGVDEKRIAAGRYAKTTHLGPYTALGDTWARFMGEWLPKSGHRVGTGSSLEVYRNNPTNARPDELRTDVYLPIT